MIFVHNYYAQPIYYTYVSKCCEPLTDWSIFLMTNLHLRSTNQVFAYFSCQPMERKHNIQDINKSIGYR